MSIFSGFVGRTRGLFSDNKGPWGSSSGGGDGDGEKPSTPKGPWKQAGGSGGPGGFGNVSSLDDWLKKNRDRFGGGGGGGGFGGTPAGNYFRWGFLAFLSLFLLFTSFHRIEPEQRGLVTRMGRYSHILSPGISLTLPAPFDRVQKVDVEKINEINLGTEPNETLMLTGDENIIDIAYQVRWKVSDPVQYAFELANQEETIRQVAESVMRQVVAQSSLQDAIGDGRGEIETQVQLQMQDTLNGYRAGVTIQGVAIKQADPPAAVNDAFKDVTAAQQQAQSYINDARAYALQLTAKAQGEAEAFDKVYEQYRQAPGVTKRRMYYETMERVLQGVDKMIVETPGVTPYLPLNELNRARRSTPSQQGGQ